MFCSVILLKDVEHGVLQEVVCGQPICRISRKVIIYWDLFSLEIIIFDFFSYNYDKIVVYHTVPTLITWTCDYYIVINIIKFAIEKRSKWEISF